MQYVLDGDIEYHDPAEPSTSSCPLLPGQMVNVLDVPIQSKEPSGRSPNGSTTSVDSLLVFTLDPKDKYLPPGVRRAATTSAIQQRKAELAATTLKPKLRSAATEPEGREGAMRTGQSTLERQRSLLSVFHRMRQTRSAGSNAKSGLAWPRKLFSRSESRAGQATKDEADVVPEVPKIPSYLPSRAPTATRDPFELPIQRPETPPPMPCRAPPVPMDSPHAIRLPVCQDDKYHVESQVASAHLESRDVDDPITISAAKAPEASPSADYTTTLNELQERHSYFMDTLASVKKGLGLNERPDLPATKVEDQDEQIAAKNAPLNRTSAKHAPTSSSTTKDTNMSERLCPASHSYAESSTSSFGVSDDCSPYFDTETTHSNPMSPLHLSQPETPIMSDFEDDIHIRRNSSSLAQPDYQLDYVEYASLRPPSRAPPPPPPPPASKPTTAYSALSGFQGYSLANFENASVLTIRKLPSNTFKPTDAASPLTQQANKQDLVQSWNDGSEHRMVSLVEDQDLAYLGELIN